MNEPQEYSSNLDTPETNAMWSRWNLHKGGDDIEGPGDFCRRKERECNRLKEELTTTSRQLAEARLFGFPMECVTHLSKAPCHCQCSGPDVDMNLHWPSCMVGKAQQFLGKKVTIKSI